MARHVIHVARQAIIVALFVIAALAGTVSGVLFAYAGDLPQISALDDYTPSTITRVYAADGQTIGEFATQRRVVIGYDDIPEKLRQAIIAGEDAEFDRHIGLSIPRIVLTALRDLIEFRKAAGASTLTQQLARKLFLTDEKTWERKIKEALLAIQIEKRYTKREILTLYCNQMYLGAGAYGVEAASRVYFGKSARDLTLEEAALVAGIFQSPSRQSPFVSLDRARARRTYVLQRLADEGYLTQAEADAAKQKPIVLRRQSGPGSLAPYFVEEVRKHLEEHYGAKRLYENGLSVRTSLDIRLQELANQALSTGLRRLDKRRGFRTPQRNVLAEGSTADAVQLPGWNQRLVPDAILPAVVTAATVDRIRIRVGAYAGVITHAGFAWTGRRPASQLVSPGDVIQVRLTNVDETAATLEASLEQEPLIEGALLVIENRSGQIKAMVGGADFERSKFNRAVQAERQVGSAFKPIVYATAIDRGYTPASLIDDVPSEFPAGPDQPPYAPVNYDRNFEGPVTLRHALEQSRNVPAVRVMQDVGPEAVIAFARRLGISSPIPPFFSVALGAAEASLLELTTAYSVFPSQGVRMTPYFILEVTDREGNVLEETQPQARDAIRADTAYVMTSLLQGVVQRGTAIRAASLDWPLGGKTGTTDDYTDAWFIGFDPDITVGVWVGYDQKKPIGEGQTGAAAALPIWIDFMKAYIDGRTEPPTFEPPGNITFLPVDRHTGQPSEFGAPDAIVETFISGTQPGAGFGRE